MSTRALKPHTQFSFAGFVGAFVVGLMVLVTAAYVAAALGYNNACWTTLSNLGEAVAELFGAY